MKKLLTFFYIVYSFSSYGQSARESVKKFDVLYDSKEYKEAMELAWKMTKDDTTAAFGYNQIGRYFEERGICDSAIRFLQLAIQLDENKSFISGWAHTDLGKCYLLTGEKEKAIVELNASIILYMTENSVNEAQRILDSIGYESGKKGRFPDWITIEGENITYEFQDTAYQQKFVLNYIDAHEKAYSQINQTFHAKLPWKLKFYIWNDPVLAKRLLGQPLGFTNPDKCICYVQRNQTVGHEMTHALSYWAWGVELVSRTRYINEGIAVAFDLNTNDKYERARNAIVGKGYHSSLEIWRDNNADEKVLYPLGGAFMLYVYQTCSLNNFKSLVKEQTIEDAQKIFGKERFEKLINDFDKKIGFQ